MSKYEERAYRTGHAKKSIADLRNQVTMLQRDLDQFLSRKPNGPMIAPLREQIRKLEVEITEAEANMKRERSDRVSSAEADAQQADDAAPVRTTTRSTSGHFPPRRSTR